MSNNINNMIINYLYNSEGKTIAVRKDTEEANIVQNAKDIEFNGEEWLTLDPNFDLNDAYSVEDLDLDQLIALYTNGDLTVDELYKGISSKDNFDEMAYNAHDEGDMTVVKFTIDGESYDINCLTEKCKYQTDGSYQTSGTNQQPNDVQKMMLASRGIPESIINSGVYSVDELMELSNTPGTELFENCYGMNASWSDEDLKYMGFDIDYYKSTYFDVNSDGTYSLKKAANENGKDGLYVEGEFISDVQALKEKLGVISLEDYFNQLPESEGGYAPRDMLSEYRFLHNVRSFGVYDYESVVADMEKKAGRSLSQAEIAFTWLSETQQSTKDYDKYMADCYIKSRLEDLKDENIKQSMMYDNAFSDLRFGNVTADFGMTQYYTRYSMYNTDAKDFFNNVVLNLENDDPGVGTFNNTVWNAMMKAAGITDNDDIQTRAQKISGYVGDTDYLELFEGLMEQGLLEQNTYSEEELHQLYTDDEIAENFYLATDTSGNSLGVYKLKRGSEIEYIEYTSPRLEAGKPTHAVTVAEANMQGYTVVSNAQELMEALNSNPKAKVVLSGNIDMNGVDWIPVGTAENPFMGTIYGNGYTISNLNIESNNQYAGLFGVFAGDAYDITMENCTVKDARGNDVPGKGGTGIFAGLITTHEEKRVYSKETTVSVGGNCTNIQIVNGNVYGRDNAGLLAGIAEPGGTANYVKHTDGIGYPGGIDHCTTSGYVYGEYAAGGLFGKYDGKHEGAIVSCKSDADINGQVWAGGIAGQSENSYLLNKGIIYNFGNNTNTYSKKDIMSAILMCDYTGEINKDIKNPPGALGAGATAGQMTVSDKIYEAVENLKKELKKQYPDNESAYTTSFNNRTLLDLGPAFKINGNIYDTDSTWSSTGMIYNTYAAGRQVGWACTLNEDGSVKDSQTVPGPSYEQGTYPGAYFVGKTADLEPISEEEWKYITENYEKYLETKNFEPLEKYRSTNTVQSAVGFITNPAAPPADKTGYATEAAQLEAIAEDQEQYITDPTYLDVIKQVILQNFIEHYDVNNPDEQLIWDQLGDGEYVTRANYKEMIERVKERTGLTDEELIQRTLEKLLNDCLKMNPKDAGANSGIASNDLIRQDSWLVSLVAAMGGMTTIMTDENDGYLPRTLDNGEVVEGYVPKSEPGQMYFKLGDYNYIISFDTKVPPEFITPEDLTSKLKDAGATDEEIQKVIKYYFKEAISKQRIGNGEKEVLMDYFAPSNAHTWHTMYGSLFKGIDDLVNFFSGNDDAYTHYWNTLALDENYRNEVMKFHHKNDNPYGGEIIDNVTSNDKYTLYPGMYIFKENKTNSLIIWDPEKETLVKTGVDSSVLYDNNGNINWEAIKANCDDEYILSLLDAYIHRRVPTTVNNTERKTTTDYEISEQQTAAARRSAAAAPSNDSKTTDNDEHAKAKAEAEAKAKAEAEAKAKAEAEAKAKAEAEAKAKAEAEAKAKAEAEAKAAEEAEETRIKAEREAYVQSVINRYTIELLGYENAIIGFNEEAGSIIQNYIDNKITKEELDDAIKALFDKITEKIAVDNKTQSDDTVITIEDYEKEAKEAAAQKGLIRDDKTGIYTKYDPVTSQTYNWLWNPFVKSFDIYTDAELETSSADERINRIRRRRQAILQRLNLTTDPNICKDKDGNFYDYNEKTGRFELRK